MSHHPRNSGWFKERAFKKPASRKLSFDALEDRRLLAAGALDPTFGTGGEASTAFLYNQPSNDSADLVVTLPDGKYIVGGSSGSDVVGEGTSSDFLLTRYNANGTLDASFGDNGEAVADFGLSSSNPTPIITGLTLTSSGQIVAVGDVSPLNQDILVARFNSDGSLDTSFNGTGMVLTPTNGTAATSGVAVQPDGRIVVGASVSGGAYLANSVFAVVRYNTDGSLDTSFGSGGIVTASLNGNVANASAIALQSDGKIVVGGSEGFTYETGMQSIAATESPQEFALVRFNANGTVDFAFGNGGEVTTAIDFGAEINAIAIQPDGKIVAGGDALATNPTGPATTVTDDDFAVARYDTNGSLDTTFGNDGIVTTDFNSHNDKLSGLVIQPNGQIVVAGSSFASGDVSVFIPSYPLPQVPASEPVSTFALARSAKTTRQVDILI